MVKLTQKQLEQQQNFEIRAKDIQNQLASLLATYQNGLSGYEYEVEIESKLKTALFALQGV